MLNPFCYVRHYFNFKRDNNIKRPGQVSFEHQLVSVDISTQDGMLSSQTHF